MADNYARTVVTTGTGDIRRRPRLKASTDASAGTVRGLGPVPDVGCGPGTVTARPAGRGLAVSGADLSPRMAENARRLHPRRRFAAASATGLDPGEASLGGVLGRWSLFNLPRDVLPQVLAVSARALEPGGHVVTAAHVGDEDAVRTEACGGVPVRWTAHKRRPERLAGLTEQAGLDPVAELRLPRRSTAGPVRPSWPGAPADGGQEPKRPRVPSRSPPPDAHRRSASGHPPEGRPPAPAGTPAGHPRGGGPAPRRSSGTGPGDGFSMPEVPLSARELTPWTPSRCAG
ncbi:class I SAM-dependent methyltransferase [Streptomyces fuscichromogenes]|uniref:class I SAM-dependent methyltransferase n=1 Tax=Streptomyces fuscichromogenes TaxID=1324013 RepID=UPI001E3E6BAA|nr:class I SAM-dependent methyltransferase [Streptomyces fuscichromogenes]